MLPVGLIGNTNGYLQVLTIKRRYLKCGNNLKGWIENV